MVVEFGAEDDGRDDVARLLQHVEVREPHAAPDHLDRASGHQEREAGQLCPSLDVHGFTDVGHVDRENGALGLPDDPGPITDDQICRDGVDAVPQEDGQRRPVIGVVDGRDGQGVSQTCHASVDARVTIRPHHKPGILAREALAKAARLFTDNFVRVVVHTDSEVAELPREVEFITARGEDLHILEADVVLGDGIHAITPRDGAQEQDVVLRACRILVVLDGGLRDDRVLSHPHAPNQDLTPSTLHRRPTDVVVQLGIFVHPPVLEMNVEVDRLLQV